MTENDKTRRHSSSVSVLVLQSFFFFQHPEHIEHAAILVNYIIYHTTTLENLHILHPIQTEPEQYKYAWQKEEGANDR